VIEELDGIKARHSALHDLRTVREYRDGQVTYRDDHARLIAAVEAVLVEHSEDVFRGHLSNGCRICGGGMGWPCPTVWAITEALKGEGA
jgi:hypothetical protein